MKAVISFPSASLATLHHDQIEWVSAFHHLLFLVAGPGCLCLKWKQGHSLTADKILNLPHPTLTRARDFGLVTVMRLPPEPNPTITAAWVLDVIAEYVRDDVFQTSFLDTVVFSRTYASDFEITQEAYEHLKQLGNRYIVIVAEPDPPPGPYALVGNEMRDVWKIVDDSFGTCMTTLRPQSR